jgi:hypothetical protein
MNYATEMGSVVMIERQSFIKIALGVQKLKGGDTQAHRRDCKLISIFLFFQNMGSKLKTYSSILKN